MLRSRACPWLFFETERVRVVPKKNMYVHCHERGSRVPRRKDVVRSNWCLRSHALHHGRHPVSLLPNLSYCIIDPLWKQPNSNGASWLAGGQTSDSRAINMFSPQNMGD